MYDFMRTLALLFLSAIYSPISQLNQSPVFGSIGPSINHIYIVNAAFVLAWTGSGFVKQTFKSAIGKYLPVLAFTVPVIHYYLYQFSAQFGPLYGPSIIELLSCFPVIFVSHYAAATALISTASGRHSGRIRHVGLGVASYLFFGIARTLSTSLLWRNVGSSIVLTRVGLQITGAFLYAILLPSKTLLLAAIPILHTLILNPHVPLSSTTTRLNTTLHMQNYSLLARQESLTGYISVLENLKDEFRVLRCDHSLLGGDWTVPQTYPSRVKEPIYSIFVMLEAVRLVETEITKQKLRIPDSKTNALVM